MDAVNQEPNCRLYSSLSELNGDQRNLLQSLGDAINEAQLPESEVERCFEEVFGGQREKRQDRMCRQKSNVHQFGWWTCLNVLLLGATVMLVISTHVPTQKFILRYSQDLIYPVMREVRMLTLPVLKLFPEMSEYHEEECLLTNPLYQNLELDCWPCAKAKIIVDLTGSPNYSSAYVLNEVPFVTRDVMKKVVTLSALRQLYTKNQNEFDLGTAKLTLNGRELKAMQTVFEEDLRKISNQELNVVWKMHRVSAARIIRKFFARPHFVPLTSEVSLQRYIFMDGPRSQQYYLPMTDFANVWLAQGQGTRTIILDPVAVCRANCSSIAMTLRSNDVLYYNWQFYRARSLPTREEKEISVTFVGSFY